MISTLGLNWTQFTPFLSDYGIFAGMILGAFLLGLTPLRYPFQWLETYYHELSHGLMALLTWGKVGRIKLRFDGSGWCSTMGGSRILILLAGYMGAALWGGYIYLAGWLLGNEGSLTPLYVELSLLAVATLLWVRDPVTLLIMAAAGALYWLPTQYAFLQAHASFILQFIGIYVMLNAIRAPLHLIDGQHVGDGAMLADITFIPEGVWIALWLAFAMAILAACAVLTLPGLGWVLWWLT
jgi:hypothetical protein